MGSFEINIQPSKVTSQYKEGEKAITTQEQDKEKILNEALDAFFDGDIKKGMSLIQQLGIQFKISDTRISFEYNGRSYWVIAPAGGDFTDDVVEPASTPDPTASTSTDALQKAIKDMGLRATNCNGIYCQQHNPDKPAGDYSEQKHYFWDAKKQEMVEIPGVYYVSSNGKEVKNFIDNYNKQNNTKNTVTDTFDNLIKLLTIEEVSIFFEILPKEENNGLDLRKLKSGIMCEGKEIKSAEELTKAIKDGKEVSLNNAGTLSYTDDSGENVVVGTWDVVYKNGITTRTSWDLDGKKTDTTIYDNNTERQLKTIYYNENGDIKGTEEWEYNESNPDLYTRTGKDADGHINWIEHCELVHCERTTYNVMYQYTQYDSNNQVCYEEKYSTTEAFDRVINSQRDILAKIEQEMMGMQIPTPPQEEDYRLTSGNIDYDAYNKAIENYKKQVDKYHNKMNSLIQQSNRLSSEIQELEALRDEKVFNDEITVYTNKLEDLKNSPNSDKNPIALLKAELEKIKQNYSDLITEKQQLYKAKQDLNTKMLNLKVPTPPSKSDYIDADGKVNEQKYSEAMKQYEYEKQEYERESQDINAQVAILIQQLAVVEEVKLKEVKYNLNQLGLNVNAIKTVQDLIDNVENIPENQSLITELNKKLEEIYNDIESQNKAQQTRNHLQNNMLNLTIPVSPSTLDYKKPDGSIDEHAYSKAFEEYEQAKVKYENDTKQYNKNINKISQEISVLNNHITSTVFDATVLVVENKIKQLKTSGNNDEANMIEEKLNILKKEFTETQKQKTELESKEQTILKMLDDLIVPNPPKTINYTKDNGEFDQGKYKEAMNIYDNQMNTYQHMFNNLNVELDNTFTNWQKLNNMLIEIQINTQALI